jgi:hypothetical protein
MEKIIKATEVQLRYNPSRVSKEFPVVKCSATAAKVCRAFFTDEPWNSKRSSLCYI